MLVHGAALLFVGGTLAAGLMATSGRLWLAILACLCAALALPATSGADWMGQHRFATAFFASAHLGFALLLVAPGPGVVRRPLDQAARLAVGLVPILALHGGWDEYRKFIAPDTPRSTWPSTTPASSGARFKSAWGFGIPWWRCPMLAGRTGWVGCNSWTPWR